MRRFFNLYKLGNSIGKFTDNQLIKYPHLCLSQASTHQKTNGRSPSETFDIYKFKKQLKSKSHNPDGIYIVHTDVADHIVKHLGQNLTNKEVFILEANPGPAVLTRALLKAGVIKLRVLEPKQVFHPNLLEIQETDPLRLEVVKADFFNLAGLAFRDKVSLSTNLDSIFADVPVKSWQDPTPPFVLCGVLPPAKEAAFLRYLMIALSGMTAPYSYGRPQLLLFVSHKQYKYMIAKPEDGFIWYIHFSCLCQLFFDIELLHQEQRTSFYPPAVKKHLKEVHLVYDDDHLYLVKMTPKKELFSLVSSPEKLQELHFFVKQNMMIRSSYVIAKLETWIPNCGPRLIKSGYNLYTRFGDLTPNQIHQLFQQFSSWPEYPSCSFRLTMFKSRMEFDEMNVNREEEDFY